MSASLDRILQSVRQRSFTTSGDVADEDCDTSLSHGDWKDAITSELHSIKMRLLVVAEDVVLDRRLEGLREILKDL